MNKFGETIKFRKMCFRNIDSESHVFSVVFVVTDKDNFSYISYLGIYIY